MTPHVMKRDGCKVPFKSERIQEAILRAALSTVTIVTCSVRSAAV
ncbi:MAG: nrdD [Enterobacter mori]|nr:nrdD [Enterobacter mori]